MKRAGLIAAAWCAGLAAYAAGQDAKGPYAQPLGGGGAVRFFESEEASKDLPTSVVLERPPSRSFAGVEHPYMVPEFGHSNKDTYVRFSIPEGTMLYGLGLSPGPIRRTGFEDQAPVSRPWLLGVRPDGTAFGLLMDTSYECRIALATYLVFWTDAPHPGVIVFDGGTPKDVLIALNEATGRMEMPPRWALGAGFELGDDPSEAARTAREARIPADYLVMPFTDPLPFGPPLIAESKSVWESLRSGGFHRITRVTPSVPQGSPLFESGTAADAWVRTVSGEPFGSKGAAAAALPDFTRKSVRSWWSAAVLEAARSEADGFLISFHGFAPEGTPVFRADSELGGEGSAEKFASMLSPQWLQATREGFRGEERDRRPFIGSPSFEIPTQRWANSPVLSPGAGRLVDFLRGETRAHALLKGALKLTLSGQPMAQAYLSGPWADDEEAAREVAIASLLPVVLVNGLELSGAHAAPEPQRAAFRAALSRRSRLIPYYYTLCFYAFRDCEPILRPLFFADPKDQSLRDRDDAFFIGADLLAVPKLESDKPKPPCPLKGGWRKIRLDEIDNPDLPDLYLRPGAILPLGPVMQYTSEKPVDPLTLLVNLDESGVAIGTLYEDDGDGYAFYRNQCRRLGYKAELKDGSVFVRLSNLDGGMPIPKRKLEVRILTDAGEITAAGSERGTIKIDLPAKPTPSP